MAPLRIALAYDGPEGEPFEVPDRNLAGAFQPEARGPQDEERLLARAFEAPAGAPRLRDAAERARSVLLLVDDVTRATRVGEILPHVARELRAARVDDARVAVLIARGTHREMTQDEVARKLGPPFVRRWSVEQHEYRDKSKLERFGETASGMPVVAHHALARSDLVVGVGHVGIHGIMGFSGGAKIVFPGVAGAESERFTHWRGAADFEPGLLMGRVDAPTRQAIEQGARLAGLDAVVNVVMDREARVQHAAFGDFVAAHRACAEVARELYAVDVPQADVVLVEAKPADRDYWQSVKALYAGVLPVREGGRIIVVAPNAEGVARNHPNVLELAGRRSDEIRSAVGEGRVDDVVGAAVALFTARIRERAGVTLVSSGVSHPDARRLGFHPARTPQEALDHALREQGPDAEVVVLRDGGGILPVVHGRNAHVVRERPDDAPREPATRSGG